MQRLPRQGLGPPSVHLASLIKIEEEQIREWIGILSFRPLRRKRLFVESGIQVRQVQIGVDRVGPILSGAGGDGSVGHEVWIVGRHSIERPRVDFVVQGAESVVWARGGGVGVMVGSGELID